MHPGVIAFQRLHGLDYGSCGENELWVSFGDVRITHLDFADDAVILAEMIEILT